MQSFTAQERVAYFSMEVALRPDIPTYAGGLGVLAGDTLRAAADCELPMVAVTLASRRGYFRQELGEDGWQREQEERWEPAQFARAVDAHVSVPIEGRDVWVGGWLYTVTGITGGRVPVILLDTDLDANQAGDRAVTHYLYGGDENYRLKQEIVLGIGGARMLDALGFRVRQYHMNEGHSALLIPDSRSNGGTRLCTSATSMSSQCGRPGWVSGPSLSHGGTVC
jgi:starch phosphorylase